MCSSMSQRSSTPPASHFIANQVAPLPLIHCPECNVGVMEDAGSGCGNQQGVDPSRPVHRQSRGHVLRPQQLKLNPTAWPCSSSTATEAQPHCVAMFFVHSN